MKLKEIEKRIIAIKKEMDGKEEELHNKVKDFLITQPQLNRMVEKENKILEQELEQLKTERQFILDTREGLFWKIIWNIIAPILVSFITTYLLIEKNVIK